MDINVKECILDTYKCKKNLYRFVEMHKNVNKCTKVYDKNEPL